MLNAVAEVISNADPLMLLWKHECLRVFADRFTTQEDKDWFEKAIKQVRDSWFISMMSPITCQFVIWQIVS